jgi:hypothetical protein
MINLYFDFFNIHNTEKASNNDITSILCRIVETSRCLSFSTDNVLAYLDVKWPQAYQGLSELKQGKWQPQTWNSVTLPIEQVGNGKEGKWDKKNTFSARLCMSLSSKCQKVSFTT